MWLSYFWLVLILVGTLMSFMGMSKLGKTGGKKGIAIAGLVIGIIALIWGVVLLLGTLEAKKGVDALKDMGAEYQQQLMDAAATIDTTTVQ
jgi:hypothetical protein